MGALRVNFPLMGSCTLEEERETKTAAKWKVASTLESLSATVINIHSVNINITE